MKVNAQLKNTFRVSDKHITNSIQIVTPGSVGSLNDTKLVSIAAKAFVNDVELLSDEKVQLLNSVDSRNKTQ